MSTFGVAVGGFDLVSRQNSVEKSVFCLLWRLRSADLGAGVEKPVFCLLWWARALDLTEEGAFRLQISGCSERGTAINKKARQTSDSLKIIF